MDNFGLSISVNKGRHQENENGEMEGGMVVVKHEGSKFTADHYAKAPSNLRCGHQMVDKGRPETKMLLDGYWLPAPDNPGKGLKFDNDLELKVYSYC